jgi:hypothetical protein
MRFTRLILAAALSGSLLALAMPAGASVAPVPRVSAGNNCVPEGQTGLYLSKEGDAKGVFSPEWVAGLNEAGIQSTGLAPQQISDDGTTMTLPVGEDFDNIELPSAHVCYPGGMTYTNPDTGATYEIKKFWVVFNPLPFNVSEFYTYPIINGVQSSKKVVFANFSTPQGVADIRPQPGGAVGPNDVKLYTNPDFVNQFNNVLGTNIRPGAPFADLNINWKGIPTKALPTTAATAGLGLIANAIKPSLGG